MLAAALALAALLAAAGPFFLCMGPTVDSSFFDVCARTIIRNGVVYRDVFLHGPPGMVWTQTAVRAVLGWSTGALRAADLAFVGAIVGLLVAGFLPRATTAGRVWAAVAMLAFYLSRSQWSHCQPDIWMLLPAVAALRLRCDSVEALEAGRRPSAARAIAEGVCWGAAALFKPFVAAPALCCWAAGVTSVGRVRRRPWAAVGADLALIALGGCLALALAALAVWRTGDMPSFVAEVFGPWNREYFETGSRWPLRLLRAVREPFPWSLVHFAALPVAVRLIWRRPQDDLRRVLLAAFYLGWFAQANFVQRQYEYQLVPPIILGICLLAGEVRGTALAIVAAAVALAATVARFPLQEAAERDLWLRCVRQGSTPGVRNALRTEDATTPDWLALAEVAEHLRDLRVRDGELTCYSLAAVPLYLQLDVQPSTRFVLLWSALTDFPDHRAEIGSELAASRQRYVVNDLVLLGFTPSQARALGGGRALPRPDELPGELAGYFPWTEPMVFRRGRYVVHEVRPNPGGAATPRLWWSGVAGESR